MIATRTSDGKKYRVIYSAVPWWAADVVIEAYIEATDGNQKDVYPDVDKKPVKRADDKGRMAGGFG